MVRLESFLVTCSNDGRVPMRELINQPFQIRPLKNSRGETDVVMPPQDSFIFGLAVRASPQMKEIHVATGNDKGEVYSSSVGFTVDSNCHLTARECSSSLSDLPVLWRHPTTVWDIDMVSLANGSIIIAMAGEDGNVRVFSNDTSRQMTSAESRETEACRHGRHCRVLMTLIQPTQTSAAAIDTSKLLPSSRRGECISFCEKRRLQKFAKGTRYGREEDNIIALAYALLFVTGLTIDNGYQENCYRGWGLSVSIISIRIPDKCKVLAIGCLKGSSSVEDRNELEALMRKEGFRNGVLMDTWETTFYWLNDDSEFLERVCLAHDADQEKIIDMIFKIRPRDIEVPLDVRALIEDLNS